jgi:ketosteroid isomerase-like protein
MTRMINKKTAASWLLLLSMAAVARASEEEAVLQALHAGCAAFEKGDAEALTRLLDEKFTLTDSRGTVTTREENLAEVRNREPRYEVFRNHQMKVRFYGQTALVNGITSVKGTAGGQPFEADFQFTDTLVKRGGQWVLVASHASRRASAP